MIFKNTRFKTFYAINYLGSFTPEKRHIILLFNYLDD